MVSFVEVYLSGLNSGIRADEVSLDEQRLVISTLDLSLVVICVFDSDCMRVFLVLTSECFLINPFAIVLTQPIEIHPDSALTVTCYSLWPFYVNRYFVLPVLDIDKRSAGITIPIDVVKFIRGEECLIILVFEHFSLDC